MSSIATVVIVNYNGAHLLPACLDALDAQRDPKAPFDTIVVDNASVDGSVALLEAKYPWVRVLKNEANLGFAGGNNVALEQVQTPFVVLLNNDATPEPGWLVSLLAPFGQPGNENVGIVTGKIVFMPHFAELTLQTPGFRPSSADTRDLGVRVYKVTVNGEDVTDRVLWDQAAYGPEGTDSSRYRWTRPDGRFLVPMPQSAVDTGAPVEVALAAMAESAKPLTITAQSASATGTIATDVLTTVQLSLDASVPLVDVINNAGGIVLADGSGADRGFHEVDLGQYDAPAEVFNACGNGMAMRTIIGRELGWFDGRFFMYYEDTDLSWRWRSGGWTIRYEPTAQLRHIHSASSKEWSPLWMFHVERNRLLMLTKNASRALALAAVLTYVRAAVGGAVRDAVAAVRSRRRPQVRVHLLRAKVMISFLRLLPRTLLMRRALSRNAAVSHEELERFLVKHR